MKCLLIGLFILSTLGAKAEGVHIDYCKELENDSEYRDQIRQHQVEFGVLPPKNQAECFTVFKMLQEDRQYIKHVILNCVEWVPESKETIEMFKAEIKKHTSQMIAVPGCLTSKILDYHEKCIGGDVRYCLNDKDTKKIFEKSPEYVKKRYRLDRVQYYKTHPEDNGLIDDFLKCVDGDDSKCVYEGKTLK